MSYIHHNQFDRFIRTVVNRISGIGIVRDQLENRFSDDFSLFKGNSRDVIEEFISQMANAKVYIGERGTDNIVASLQTRPWMSKHKVGERNSDDDNNASKLVNRYLSATAEMFASAADDLETKSTTDNIFEIVICLGIPHEQELLRFPMMLNGSQDEKYLELQCDPYINYVKLASSIMSWLPTLVPNPIGDYQAGDLVQAMRDNSNGITGNPAYAASQRVFQNAYSMALARYGCAGQRVDFDIFDYKKVATVLNHFRVLSLVSTDPLVTHEERFTVQLCLCNKRFMEVEVVRINNHWNIFPKCDVQGNILCDLEQHVKAML